MTNGKVRTIIMLICIYEADQQSIFVPATAKGKSPRFPQANGCSLVHQMNPLHDSQQAEENVFNVWHKQPLLL